MPINETADFLRTLDLSARERMASEFARSLVSELSPTIELINNPDFRAGRRAGPGGGPVERVEQAREDFADLFGGIPLRDRSFLDIGFGQALSLLIATAAGTRSR